jgi:hypothetical protein
MDAASVAAAAAREAGAMVIGNIILCDLADVSRDLLY